MRSVLTSLLAPIALLFAVGPGLPGTAIAAEEEWLIAAEPGWSWESGVDAHRLGGGLTAALGLSPAAWAFVGGAARAPISPAVGVGWEAVAGVQLALDVLRTIPFLEVGGGVAGVGDRLGPLLRVGIGADHLITPSLGLGAVVRVRALAGVDEARGLSLALRLTWRDEW
jgi:hypothetical protein